MEAMPQILVIEDDALIREMLEDMLTDAGYDVETAEDGAVGLKKFARNPAALVITDIIMPNTEGMETIHAIKKRLPSARILAISGGGNSLFAHDLLDMARIIGADAALPKPFSKNALLTLVRSLFGKMDSTSAEASLAL